MHKDQCTTCCQYPQHRTKSLRFPVSLWISVPLSGEALLNSESRQIIACHILLLFSIGMIKNLRVQKLFIENNIERDNYTLVVRLKKKIEELNAIIADQAETILSFKKDVKTTKINEMEIEIQHLNDENKRLLLVIDEMKGKARGNNVLSPKKTLINTNKFEERRPMVTEIKYENKMYDVLKENELLKKELLSLKVNENLIKKRKSTLNDRSSIFIEKNLIDYQKLYQKKMDLEAERVMMADKIRKLETKVGEICRRNEELEKIHHRHLVVDPPEQQ